MINGVLLLVAVFGALAALVLAALRRYGQVRLWVPAILFLTAPLEVYLVDVGPLNLSLFRIALCVCAAVTVVDVWRRRPPTFDVPLPFLPYAVLISLQAISLAFVTPAHTLGAKFMSEYVAGLAAAAMIVWFTRGQRPRTILALFLASAILPALASIWRTIATAPGHQRPLPGLSLLPVDPVLAATRNAGSYLDSGIKRMEGTFGDPNHFAFFLALVLIVALAWSLQEMMQRRRAGWILASLLGVAGICATLIVGSYSRSSWILSAVGVCGICLLAGRERWRRLVTPRRLAASLGVLAVIAVVLLPIVISRINPANAASRTSDQIHEQTAKLALNLLRAHPLTGVGLGAYGGYAHEPHLVSSAHSTFLTTAAELGVPGVLALLAAMGTTAFFAIRFVRRRHDSPDHLLIGGTAAAFVAIALANLVYEVWTDDFQWVFFGIVVGLTSQPAVGLKPAVVRRLRAARRRAGLPDVAAMRIDAERR